MEFVADSIALLTMQSIIFTIIVAIVALALIYAKHQINQRSDASDQTVIDAINNCLPQTQCAQCGHPGCLPYAQAIAEGEPINRCPPGGEPTIQALANLLGRSAEDLDPAFGTHTEKSVAHIREDDCIGCTLCIAACPVDAIIGAQQLMHSVLTDVCTGCDLCLPPCPVDCIDMISIEPEPILIRPLKPLTNQTTGPCIRCGECEPVCPKDLSPQNLHWQRSSPDALKQLSLNACIECRLCDRVCPSAIPLTEQFVEAKNTLKILEIEQQEASEAEQRFKKRQIRLVSEEQIVKTKPSQTDRQALLARLRK